MKALKTAAQAAAILLCFGVGSALAAQGTPGGATGTEGVTNGVTSGATTTPPGNTTETTTPPTGNTNTANPSADVVKDCQDKADKQGLAGDAKGAFITECEKTPVKKQ